MATRCIFQIGFVKNHKMSQSIEAFINDEKVNWDEDCGQYLTTHKDRVQKRMIWFMCDWEFETEDVLRILVKTYLPGIGQDEERTFETLYYVDEGSPVREHAIKGVGHKDYPLIKGRFQEIGTVSEEDKRRGKISDFINGEF